MASDFAYYVCSIVQGFVRGDDEEASAKKPGFRQNDLHVAFCISG
jgi:hypothetical protein